MDSEISCPFDAAAAAKSLQSCPTLWDPMDGSPPGSPVHGILQARTLERVAISFSNAWKWKVKVKSLSRVQLFATPWTAAYRPQGFPGKSSRVSCHCLIWCPLDRDEYTHKKQILREKTEYTWFEKKLAIYTFKQGNLQYLFRTNIVELWY